MGKIRCLGGDAYLWLGVQLQRRGKRSDGNMHLQDLPGGEGDENIGATLARVGRDGREAVECNMRRFAVVEGVVATEGRVLHVVEQSAPVGWQRSREDPLAGVALEGVHDDLMDASMLPRRLPWLG